LRQVFEKYKTYYDALVTKLFGALDEVASKIDHELGDRIMMLHNTACTTPIDQMAPADIEALVKRSIGLLRLQHLDIRLRPLLGTNAFAKDLFDCIALLARPHQAFDTMVRAASSFPTFGTVRLCRGFPVTKAIAPSASPSSSRSQISPIQSSKSTEKAESVPYTPKAFEHNQPLGQITVVKSDSTDDFFSEARKYLPPHERHIGVWLLEPPAKRSAYLLVAAITRGQNPLPEWDAYYAFGYPACHDEDEAQFLGGIYKEILLESESKPAIFHELWKALNQNKLVQLIDKHGYSLFRGAIAGLERFLSTPVADREPVWELVQFVRARKFTDRPPRLLYDYNFKLCRMRETVVVLKDLYSQILEVVDPMQLHDASKQGRLLEIALEAHPNLTPEHRRLLRK
jgi:hypothetical protein